MTKEEYNQQELPNSDTNSELETLSRKLLHQMFDSKDFEIRDEVQHDKGIDLIIEIKSNGCSTNLRFPIQLKATRSGKRNKDGTLSQKVSIRNINYLLNDGLPAYYVLYHQNENLFFYERAEQVEKTHKKKYPKGGTKSVTFRFDKIFDQTALADIHSEMLSRGFLRRNINAELSMEGDHNSLKNNIVVKKDLTVYSPSANQKYLENFGYQLLNQGSFVHILEIEKECYPLTQASAKFHFVCGTASHYTGRLTMALDHFKKASKNVKELHPETQTLMQYYIAHSKRSLGMIDTRKSAETIATLMDSEYFGLYLRLEKAYEVYQTGKTSPQIRIAEFKKNSEAILSHPSCSRSLKLMADSYLLSIRARELNDKFLNYLLKGKDAYDFGFPHTEAYNVTQQEIDDYVEHFTTLLDRAKEEGNHFTYHNICLEDIKSHYFKVCYQATVLGLDRRTMKLQLVLNDNEKSLLYEKARYAGEIADIFKDFSASRNMIAALSLQFEILHFMGDMERAEEVYQKMMDLITENDWHGVEKEIAHLKNGETTYELFTQSLISMYTNAERHHEEMDRLRMEVYEMDAQDELENRVFSDQAIAIQVFPLGNFRFEKTSLGAILHLLNLTVRTKQQILDCIARKTMPVINVYHNPVPQEGPAGGFSAEQASSWLRLHQVRTELRNVGAKKI